MSKIYNYENFISEHLTQFGALLQLESEYKKLLEEDATNPQLGIICDKICKLLRLRNYQIVKGIVNVEDTVMLDSRSLHGSKKIQTIPVKFGIIEGSFFCDRNALISLNGSPKEVGQTFDCHENSLGNSKHGFLCRIPVCVPRCACRTISGAANTHGRSVCSGRQQ